MSSELIQPVECKLFVAGTELSSLYESLEEVKVEMRRGEAAVCTIVLDSIRLEDGEWSVQDGHASIRPWAELVVEAHFGQRTEQVMSGHIKEVRLEFPQEMSAAKVTITAQDYSIRLDREHLRANQSTGDDPVFDGQIARRLAKASGLQAEATDGLRNASLNADGTAITFLKTRAEANGFELFVSGRTLHFHPIRLNGTPQPTILVYAGRSTNCLSFNVQHDGHRPDQVRATVAAETGTEPEEILASPDLPVLGEQAANSENSGLSAFVWNLNSPNGASAQELERRVQAAANEQAWKIIAEGELDGALYGDVLRNYETVEVDGVGSTYSGRYYVADVTHSFTSDGYRQRFKLLRNALGQRSTANGQGAGPERLANARQR